MRVLQAMAGAEHGGAETFFTRLVPALARAGIEQRAIIRAFPERANVLREAGVSTAQVRFGGAMDLASRLRFRREVADFKPDIVLSWMNRATAMCPRGRFVHVGRLGGYYDLSYYRRCDHLIANTEDIVDYLVRNGWPRERAHYVPNFVAADPVPPASRAELYTPPGAPIVLAMGRLHQNKAFDTLLRAMTRAMDAYLWIAGEGPEREALNELASRLAVKPRIRFLGWRSDTAALLAAADVLVCPSRHEPLGNVVIEAFAHGVPVIATASDGPRRLVQNMRTGLLVPVDDWETLGEAIRYLLDRPELATELADGGRATYQAHFTETRIVGAFRDVFQRLMDSP